MNERFRQLYDTALVAAGKENQFETTHLHVAEKFAELIVKETMQVVAKNVAWNSYLNAAEAAIEHFGVEE